MIKVTDAAIDAAVRAWFDVPNHDYDFNKRMRAALVAFIEDQQAETEVFLKSHAEQVSNLLQEIERLRSVIESRATPHGWDQ